VTTEGFVVHATRWDDCDGGADHGPDRRSGVPVVTGANDGITEHAFCVGSGKERCSDET
jgi:hypothetical protein